MKSNHTFLPFALSLSLAALLCMRLITRSDGAAAKPPEGDSPPSQPACTTQPSPTTQSLLPLGSAPDFPQIQLNFIGKAKDGRAWPCHVPFVELVADDNTWSCGYPVNATSLRLGIGLKQELRQLVVHRGYHTRGLPEDAEFSVPDARSGGIVIKDLVIANEGVGPGGNASSAKLPTNVAIQGTITDPTPLDEMRGGRNDALVTYTYGGSLYMHALDTGGTFMLPSCPLGGELLVGSRHFGSAAFYVRSVANSEVVLPRDSTYTFSPKKLAEVTLQAQQFSDRDSICVCAYIGPACRSPIAWIEHKGDSGSSVNMKLPRGLHLWIRLLRAAKPDLDVGKISVPNDGGPVPIISTTQP